MMYFLILVVGAIINDVTATLDIRTQISAIALIHYEGATLDYFRKTQAHPRKVAMKILLNCCSKIKFTKRINDAKKD